jgi:hypothetical protein
MCLEIRKRTDCNSVGLPMLCEGGCEPAPHKDENMGTRVALILGRPAAALCKGCAGRWEDSWTAADADYLNLAEAA